MTASLTTLISKVQALLLDDGTNYTTNTCTAAIRQALKEYNDIAPNQSATLLTAVAGQKEYQLVGADFTNLIDILGVWLNDTDGEDDTELDFTPFYEDQTPCVRLDTSQSSGDLLISFTNSNTINGLDSEVISTVPAIFDQVLVDGGAYYAVCIRAIGRVEPINLNRDVPKSLQALARIHKINFEIGRRRAAHRPPRRAKSDPTWEYNPTSF